MQNNNNNRNNNKKHNNNRTPIFDSNGPEGRIKGTAKQLGDKYTSFARDAYSRGDAVLMENYYQHAEHYYRVNNYINMQQEAKRKQRTEDKEKREAEKKNNTEKELKTEEKTESVAEVKNKPRKRLLKKTVKKDDTE